ncbi:undecaprenyldiphospho-muramoylpentapeptide beta-N-acetylglucosaminyltransferase [Nitratiruptor tergarcus]|uniref:UDP-N-acetylglucosamine--N-acetylmuramyl-(pentapeptide) pyrophosphoryl-undecaprenol N-acetylglucosamine transferase n=1 Tax=Nitratiruptor tergarcus DSM 16512 TaxID=1069081 RepID=A0A1W1WPV9_9BACT|nr:undecaprenyldiphospho-muramoylpentapeptide beta-N-acetylglucosaminyltransferase [Nitratiruptor tergarcus]SMC08337.1 UDP-N-acetylglucosamine-N-acetylmuramylpentapeptide N-acetylglucosamine transferase [Nitratiruptor tergarcus DSM 16512]
MNILLTGGGTGGHLAIAKSLNSAFVKQGVKTFYIGSTYGQDREWFESDKSFSQKWFFESRGVINQKGVKKLSSLWNISHLALKSKEIIKNYNIDAVVSVGGYSAAPASFGALLSSTPLFIHEQNARFGKLNTLLSPFAKRVFCSFTPPFDPYPVNPEFLHTRRVRTKLKTIIFLGGSQGAKQINDIALQNAPLLASKKISIIHQTGKQDYRRVKNAYEKMGIEAEVFAFDKNLAHKMAQADFAVSRAGASTLWELCANALPALFVPYPYAAGNHQYYNAKYLVNRGAAFLYPDHALEEIIEADLSPLSQKLFSLAPLEGATTIAQTIVQSLKTT